MPIRYFKMFLQTDCAAGILLMAAAVLALIAKNSFLAPYYDAFLHFPLSIEADGHKASASLLFVVNDGLMALFFLVVGLELKKEMLEGALSKPSQVILPAMGAVGGMVIPSLIYAAFTWQQADYLRGWAVPAATDIAFSLGVLSLLGKRVPLALKIFLTSLAIFDDVGAIIIIAAFYASHLSWAMLGGSLVITILLVILNRMRVGQLVPYMLLGGLLWYCVLHSGIHPTIAGVILAFTIPLRLPPHHSPLKRLEHLLAPWVSYSIIPLFGFMNAGVAFTNLTLADLLHPVTAGITLGLFIGKQIGILLFCFLFTKLKWAGLPEHTNWWQFYGMSLLAGIGFTMSLFIGSLAFHDDGVMNHVKLGVLTGSLLSAIAGYAVLRLAKRAV